MTLCNDNFLANLGFYIILVRNQTSLNVQRNETSLNVQPNQTSLNAQPN